MIEYRYRPYRRDECEMRGDGRWDDERYEMGVHKKWVMGFTFLGRR
jgi:hypothetical protein